MKRIAMLCVILTLLCSVTACGANPPAATQGNTPAGITAPIVTDGAVATHVPQESEGKEAETPKVLVAYFSCTGTTERLRHICGRGNRRGAIRDRTNRTLFRGGLGLYRCGQPGQSRAKRRERKAGYRRQRIPYGEL